MDLATVCSALAQAREICPDAQFYGEDTGGTTKYVISLDGSSPGTGWTLGSCPQ